MPWWGKHFQTCIVTAAVCTDLHDGVVWVDLQGLLGGHVGAHAVVPQRLGLHDTLHVCTPAVLASDQHTWAVHNAVRHYDLQGSSGMSHIIIIQRLSKCKDTGLAAAEQGISLYTTPGFTMTDTLSATVGTDVVYNLYLAQLHQVFLLILHATDARDHCYVTRHAVSANILVQMNKA